MKLATLTFYNDLEDSFGSTTARTNPDGKFQAIQGLTIAVDPEVIPYKSWVCIPALADLSIHPGAIFFAHDTGSAVKSRKSSIAHGNDYPVIDVFMKIPTEDLFKMNGKYGTEVEYEII